MTSKDSDTNCSPMDPGHALRLELRGYLTPSLNVMLGQHWTRLHKFKSQARAALFSALRAAATNSSTSTTWREAVSRSLTNSVTPDSYRTIRRTKSKSFSAKKKSRKAKR